MKMISISLEDIELLGCGDSVNHVRILEPCEGSPATIYGRHTHTPFRKLAETDNSFEWLIAHSTDPETLKSLLKLTQ